MAPTSFSVIYIYVCQAVCLSLKVQTIRVKHHHPVYWGASSWLCAICSFRQYRQSIFILEVTDMIWQKMRLGLGNQCVDKPDPLKISTWGHVMQVVHKTLTSSHNCQMSPHASATRTRKAVIIMHSYWQLFWGLYKPLSCYTKWYIVML